MSVNEVLLMFEIFSLLVNIFFVLLNMSDQFDH